MKVDTTTPQWNTISAYLSGELDDTERLSFESWLQESKDNQFLFEEARKIWTSSRLKLALTEDSTEEELNRLTSRIGAEENNSKNIRWLRSPWLRVAAGVTLAVTAAWIYLSLQSSEEFVISAGKQVATLYLPDSTRVWLNTGSKLAYTKEFNVTERRVTLEGEGYFDVTPDSTRPFRVLTPTTITRVVGTSFNIKDTDTLTTLTVAEGKVNFSERDDSRGEVLRVIHDEEATFHHRDQILKKSGITNIAYAGWRRTDNPAFYKEKQNPLAFLATRYAWRKNRAHQSEVYGKIWNHASLASYKNVVLKVTYAQPGGAPKTMRIKTEEVVLPGRPIEFRKKLGDQFTNTSYLTVEVESADIIEHDHE